MKLFTRHYMPITNFRQYELQTTLHVTQYSRATYEDISLMNYS